MIWERSLLAGKHNVILQYLFNISDMTNKTFSKYYVLPSECDSWEQCVRFVF